MTTSEEIESWRAGLDALHERIAGRFRRSEARQRAKQYLAGLLDRIDREFACRTLNLTKMWA
jgi:deoxyadenosine/deoxycytidine kinase